MTWVQAFNQPYPGALQVLQAGGFVPRSANPQHLPDDCGDPCGPENEVWDWEKAARCGWSSATLHRCVYGTEQHPMDPGHPRWRREGSNWPDTSTVYPRRPYPEARAQNSCYTGVAQAIGLSPAAYGQPAAGALPNYGAPRARLPNRGWERARAQNFQGGVGAVGPAIGLSPMVYGVPFPGYPSLAEQPRVGVSPAEAQQWKQVYAAQMRDRGVVANPAPQKLGCPPQQKGKVLGYADTDDGCRYFVEACGCPPGWLRAVQKSCPLPYPGDDPLPCRIICCPPKCKVCVDDDACKFPGVDCPPEWDGVYPAPPGFHRTPLTPSGYEHISGWRDLVNICCPDREVPKVGVSPKRPRPEGRPFPGGRRLLRRARARLRNPSDCPEQVSPWYPTAGYGTGQYGSQYGPNQNPRGGTVQHGAVGRVANPVWPLAAGAAALAGVAGGAWWRTSRATQRCRLDPSLLPGGSGWLTADGALDPEMRDPLRSLFDDQMGGVYGPAPETADALADRAIQLASAGLDQEEADRCQPQQAYWGRMKKVRAAVRNLAAEYLAEFGPPNGPNQNPLKRLAARKFRDPPSTGTTTRRARAGVGARRLPKGCRICGVGGVCCRPRVCRTWRDPDGQTYSACVDRSRNDPAAARAPNGCVYCGKVLCCGTRMTVRECCRLARGKVRRAGRLSRSRRTAGVALGGAR